MEVGTIKAYKDFIISHPSSEYDSLANAKIDDLKILNPQIIFLLTFSEK